MVFDCFTYAGEIDLLRLRLETLGEVVDRFVIAEATRSFSGKARTVSLNPSRLGPYRHKITHIVVDDLHPRPASAWRNEYAQRNALVRGLAHAQPHDLVMLSDVDEIPRPESISLFRPRRFLSALLHLRVFYYALNHEMVSSADAWDLPCRCIRITTAGRLHRIFGSLQNLRHLGSAGRFPRLMGALDRKILDRCLTQQLPDAGWHFSYLMTPERMAAKIAGFSHQEFNRPPFNDPAHLQQAMRLGQDLFGRDRQFLTRPVDASFPRPVQLQPARFGPWLWPVDGAQA